jgi:hypothetical protein
LLVRITNGANYHLDVSDIKDDFFADAPLVILQSEIPENVVKKVVGRVYSLCVGSQRLFCAKLRWTGFFPHLGKTTGVSRILLKMMPKGRGISCSITGVHTVLGAACSGGA